MLFFLLKVIGAGIIIAFASWLAGQNPKLAGFIIALPLVSLIAILFSYYEHNDTAVSYTHLTLPTKRIV